MPSAGPLPTFAMGRRGGVDAGLARIAVVALVAVAGITAIVAGAVVVDRFANPDRIIVLDADPGDCFTLPIDPNLTELVEIERQDCAEPHDAEIVSVGELNPDGGREYPDDDLLFDLVDVACGDPRRFLDNGFGILPVAPNERAWDRGGGRFVCVAVSLDGELVTGQHFAPRQAPDGSVGDGEESARG